MAWKERMDTIKQELQEWIKVKIANPTSLDNGIKMGVVNLCCCSWDTQF